MSDDHDFDTIPTVVDATDLERLDYGHPTRAAMESNQEALDETYLDGRLNPRDYQPERHLSEGLAEMGANLGEGIGHGIMWAGIWVAGATALHAFLKYLPPQ